MSSAAQRARRGRESQDQLHRAVDPPPGPAAPGCDETVPKGQQQLDLLFASHQQIAMDPRRSLQGGGHASAGEHHRHWRAAAAPATPELRLNPEHALAEGIHLVDQTAPCEKASSSSIKESALRTKRLARFYHWSHGMNARGLVALWWDSDQRRHLALEQLGRPPGFWQRPRSSRS